MSWRGVALVVAIMGCAVVLGVDEAGAHPLDPVLLELRESAGGRVDVLWRLPRSEPSGAPLRPALPVSCVEGSAAAVTESGPRLTSRWLVDCGAQGLIGQRIGIEGLRERRTEALVRIELPDGTLIQGVLRGDRAALTVPARRGRLVVAWDYLGLGLKHILTGLDHLLFVLGLVMLVRGGRRLGWTITAFTAGHSITLSLAVLGVVRVPAAPVEVLIAGTIVAVAAELTRARPTDGRWIERVPTGMGFAVGLLHGLGFAGALAQTGLPASEIPLALFAFNVGIEIGQLGFVAAVVAIRATVGASPLGWSAAGARLPAYAIGSLAAFWVIDRFRSILP